MIREEEIKVSALKYLDNFIPDICGYCDEDIFDAYKSGAKWVDEKPNLESLWHNASEEPKEYPIIYQDEFSDVWIMQFSLKDYVDGWEEFKDFECLTRWAYVSDLLPKTK